MSDVLEQKASGQPQQSPFLGQQPQQNRFSPSSQQPQQNPYASYGQQPQQNPYASYSQQPPAPASWQPQQNRFSPYGQQPQYQQNRFSPYGQQPQQNRFSPYGQQPQQNPYVSYGQQQRQQSPYSFNPRNIMDFLQQQFPQSPYGQRPPPPAVWQSPYQPRQPAIRRPRPVEEPVIDRHSGIIEGDYDGFIPDPNYRPTIGPQPTSIPEKSLEVLRAERAQRQLQRPEAGPQKELERAQRLRQRLQREQAAPDPELPPIDPVYTPGTPDADGFIPPPKGSMNTQALVKFWNPTTGEVVQRSSGGWTPPPGWEVDRRTGSHPISNATHPGLGLDQPITGAGQPRELPPIDPGDRTSVIPTTPAPRELPPIDPGDRTNVFRTVKPTTPQPVYRPTIGPQPTSRITRGYGESLEDFWDRKEEYDNG